MNRWLFALWLAGGLAFLGMVLLFGRPVQLPKGNFENEASLEVLALSKPAILFSMERRDGKSILLKDFLNRYVIINFWATWCEPCLEELPHLLMLAKILEKFPVTFLLVLEDGTWEDFDKLLKELEKNKDKWFFSWLRGENPSVIVVKDEENDVAKAYGTFKYPETYLIDNQGMIRFRFVGPRAWSKKQLVDFFKIKIGN